MRFVPRKKISELELLDSASVNTYIVGIDGGVTYKIGINEFTDTVIASITGSTGTSGTSGVAGTSGTNGTSGTSVVGSSGTSGTSAVGSSGTSGINGTQGPQGPQGNDGSTANVADFTFTSETISNNNITLDANDNITLQTGNGDIILDADGGVYIGSTGGGNSVVTGGYLDSVIGDTNTVNNGTGHTITDNLTNIINSIPTNYATTGSNYFDGYQQINGSVSASSFIGKGRYLTNLSPSTNWNYNQEYTVKKTEQLTFSGDYILEDTLLEIEGGVPNSIGEWTFETWDTNGTYTQTANNQYTITGPTGNTNASIGIWMHRQFDTNTTMSIDYVWNGEDVGNDWPIYAVDTQYPYEINTENRLQDINATTESGTWTINVPSGSWLSIGVNTANVNASVGTLQITLPYLFGEDVEYSSNKFFKKEGTIFIGGNLLVKDSYIVNDGKISVGGEVILIGNSQIVGTGIII